MANVDLRPIIGDTYKKISRARILLVCFFDPNGISTVWENIRLLQDISIDEYVVLNLWPGHGSHLFIPASVDLTLYDGIFIHPTVCYNPANLLNLDSALRTKFADYEGLKILAKQDEHFMTSLFDRFLVDQAFDVLLTCVPECELQKAYPRASKAKVKFVPTLTGYVSTYMREFVSQAYESRTIDLCYRGSLQPISFGRLAFEKWYIGQSIDESDVTNGLRKDISSRWEDRKNGKEWYNFLTSSRATLGVESGSNIFDFDGHVSRRCEEYISSNPQSAVYSRDFYEKINRDILSEYEGNVRYAQVSPRHFEAAATKTLQIMYEGEYSGIFQPDLHYFSLRRDLSNLAEAVDLIRDSARATRIVTAAYEEIIMSDDYTYQTFVRAFDAVVEQCLQERGWLTHPSKKARVLNLCAHDPVADPRIEWHSKSLLPDRYVCELGTYGFGAVAPAAAPSVETLAENHYRVRVERTSHNSRWKQIAIASRAGSSEFSRVMNVFDYLKDSDRESLNSIVGSFDADKADIFRFQDLCRYILNTNSALYENAIRLGPFDTIICADLESLPAAIGLKELWGCQVVFDSHEFWPFSYVEFRHWENDFWSRIERQLACNADIRITVSDTLAATLTNEYGCAFESIPNATLLSDAPVRAEVDQRRAERLSMDSIDFLFQGNFAEGRGIDQIIFAWVDAPPRARLLLRGPHNQYRAKMIELARSLHLLDKTVFFLEAVSEQELVRRAMDAHVGIIPYDPKHYANRFACPNKLSQYMAAGVPIICNEIDYVKSIVVNHDIGLSCDMAKARDLIDRVSAFADDRDMLDRYSVNSRNYFEASFNWEFRSRELYARVPLNSSYLVTAPDPYTVMAGVAAGRKRMGVDASAGVKDPDTASKEQSQVSTASEEQSQVSDYILIQISSSSPPIAFARAAWRSLPWPLRRGILRMMRIS